MSAGLTVEQLLTPA